MFFYFYFYFLCCRHLGHNCPVAMVKAGAAMAWGVLVVVIAYCDAADECTEYKYNRCN